MEVSSLGMSTESMGRILEYVVLLSNLSLILGGQQFKDNYEREKQENFTQSIRQYYPKGQNEFFSRRGPPLDHKMRKRLQSSDPKQMRRFVGLHAFATDDFEKRNQKRNFSDSNFRNSNLPRRNIFPHSQPFYPRKNSKNFASFNFHNEVPSQKLSRLYDPNNSSNPQNKRPEDISRRYHNNGRNARYHPRHAAKICDPCNSVPWVPLLKVPDSYRKQRTHVTELHPTHQQNFNFDYHGFASNTHDVLLPPVPLVPPLEPIYDGTISSSFGLPIGNIPTSHGMLAPVSKYVPNSIDYSSSFNFFSPHGLLESHTFPELSPVPVVPIHDSGQFFQFDSSIPDLVPPPAKHVDVSKVVLTIEENSQNHKDSSLASTAVDSQASHPRGPGNNQKDFGKLEIIKSVPLAEFTSSVDFPKQDLPLYPPLQYEQEGPKKDFNAQKPVAQQSSTNYDYLVPPEKSKTELGTSGKSGALDREASAPKPLTSPSLSWLFSDHTAPPTDSKSTSSMLSFATDTQEIASVVNNELRPVSPHPVPVSSTTSQNVGNAKSKKIQIIIPYTTKNKNGHDNNALESVQHEVFQPPVSKSTSENNSVRDLATPALPPLTHKPETTRDKKVIDEFENQNEDEKKISEMHHIIASNLRELLREEIEKSQSDQNYPLQNNIDNWTALEYSNHKTVGTKEPKEIITQALAVTSIPGTSISHLLLPSKKIPKEYFKTTPIPVFDEPSNSAYKTTNTTVNSSPFTAKPYATTNVYNPRPNENKENTPSGTQINHERNYTEVTRGRVNNWGRLNENLVLPEARSKTRRIYESTTTPSWSSNRYVSSGSEKVQIVTPISLTTERNYTTAFRRTTRHIQKTLTPTTETPHRTFHTRLNSTKLEKVTNETFPINRKFSFNPTTPHSVVQTTTVKEKTNSSVSVSAVQTNITIPLKNETSKDLNFSEHLSINDIIPFRNKELPWESNLNNSQNILQVGRQRKSLIKQVNLPKSKKPVSSS